MSWGKTENRPKIFYFTVISLCLNFLVLVLLLWMVGNLKENIASNKIVASMVTNKEDEEFIKKMCEDLKLENEVTMIVGPYYVYSFFSPSLNHQLSRLLSEHPIVIDPTDLTGKILIEKSLYKKLDTEERQAAIAHSISHIYFYIHNNYTIKPWLDSEIEVNRLAVRYVSADVLINLYREYGNGYAIAGFLIEDLEKQKLTVFNKKPPKTK